MEYKNYKHDTYTLYTIKTDKFKTCHLEIIFKNKSGSEIVADRINFIKTCTLDEIFITKWLVLPAFYRDVDVYSSKKNDINIMYQFIISQASMLKSSKGMFNDDYIVTDAHKNIQTKNIATFLK